MRHTINIGDSFKVIKQCEGTAMQQVNKFLSGIFSYIKNSR